MLAVRALMAKVDNLPERVLLWTNVALACLVGVSHGGALAITYVKPTPDAEGIRLLASISLPSASLIVLTAAIALVKADLRRITLGLHGWILAAGSAAALAWAGSLLVRGIPQGSFGWSPGLLTVMVCYSVFVASRYGAPGRLRALPVLNYAPLLALAISLPIDVGVFIKLLGEFGKRFA